jgi:hypothetical protein
LAEKHLGFYSVFCNHQAEAMADAKRLQRSSDSFIKICDLAAQMPAANGLGVLDYLVKPFQRLLKYPLLLRELIKNTPLSHPERGGLEAATAKIQAVVDEVEKNKAKSDNLKRMLALNNRISGLPRSIEPLVTPARRIVREGWVQKISNGNDQERYLALFNDMLVYCKRKAGDKLLFRDFIWLRELQVADVPDAATYQHAIELHRLDKKLTYVIYFASRIEKGEWHRDFVATRQLLTTLALSSTQYSDNNEYKDCIGVLRIYYEDEGQELFKTFAIGSQVQAADVVRQFSHKLRIADRLAETGHELRLQLMAGAEASFVPDTAAPLAMQLDAIKRGAQFPSPQHRFFVQLPFAPSAVRPAAAAHANASTATTAAAANAAPVSMATDVSHMVVDSPLAGHSARMSNNTGTIDFGLWTGGDMEALKAAIRSNTGSSMSVSEPSDRTTASSEDPEASGLGSAVDLLDAVLSGDNRTMRRVATKAKIELKIPPSESERLETTPPAGEPAVLDPIEAIVIAPPSGDALVRKLSPTVKKLPPLPAAASAAATMTTKDETKASMSGAISPRPEPVARPEPVTRPDPAPQQPEVAAATSDSAAAAASATVQPVTQKRAPPKLPTKEGVPLSEALPATTTAPVAVTKSDLSMIPPTKRAPVRASAPFTTQAKEETAPTTATTTTASNAPSEEIAPPKKRAPVRSSLGGNGSSASPATSTRSEQATTPSPSASPRGESELASSAPAKSTPVPTPRSSDAAMDGDGGVLTIGANNPPAAATTTTTAAATAAPSAKPSASPSKAESSVNKEPSTSTLRRFFNLGGGKSKKQEKQEKVEEPVSEINF